MKKILTGLIALIIATSSFAKQEMSRIYEKGSDRQIVFYKDKHSLSFDLVDGEQVTQLNELEYVKDLDHVRIMGSKNSYRFNFLKGTLKASGDAYNYCFSDNENIDILGFQAPATIGVAFFIVGIFGSMAICGTVPAAPAIVGIAAAPIDGVITLAGYLFDSEQIAVRKFKKALAGREAHASKKVFNILLKQLEEL